MTPYLITAPDALPVSLNEMKAHLRVVHDDDDLDIEERIASVVAHLDGWGGALGRCIMPQTWAIDVIGPGPHLLPFPEADDVTATGASGALDVVVARGAAGPCVTIASAGVDEALVVQFTSSLPSARLPAAKSLVKLMVQREFDLMAGPEAMAMDMAIGALVNGLRWRRL
jgi:hypothetical protein